MKPKSPIENILNGDNDSRLVRLKRYQWSMSAFDFRYVEPFYKLHGVNFTPEDRDVELWFMTGTPEETVISDYPFFVEPDVHFSSSRNPASLSERWFDRIMRRNGYFEEFEDRYPDFKDKLRVLIKEGKTTSQIQKVYPELDLGKDEVWIVSGLFGEGKFTYTTFAGRSSDPEYVARRVQRESVDHAIRRLEDQGANEILWGREVDPKKVGGLPGSIIYADRKRQALEEIGRMDPEDKDKLTERLLECYLDNPILYENKGR